MQLHQLSLRGFRGIHQGLGVHELTLDVRGLTGIVALVGPNGSGKTTTLECLHPFRTLPSRGISLKDAVIGRDAHKDLSFEFGGHQYRVLVTIDAHTGKSDGFLWRDEEPLTSGKISELDEQLRLLLGNPEWFFHSVFAAQAANSLLDLRPAARKDFFAEFLGLAQLQTSAETARKVAVSIEGWTAGVGQEATHLAQQVAEIPHLEAQLQACQMQAQEQQAQVTRTLAEEQQARSALDQVRQCVAQAEEVSKVVRYWQQQKATRLQTARQQRTRLAADHEHAVQKDRELAQAVRTLQEEVRRLETQSMPHANLQAEEEELQTQIGTLEIELEEVQRATERQRELAEIRATAQQEEARLHTMLTERSRLATALTTRPAAAPEDLCRSCGLAQAAWQAHGDISNLQQQLRTVQTRLHDQEAPLLARLSPTLRPLQVITAALKAARERLRVIHARRAQDGRLTQLRQERDLKTTLLEHHQQTVARTADVLAEFDASVHADVQRFEAEIAKATAATQPGLPEQLRTAEHRVATLVTHLNTVRETLARTQAQITTLTEQREGRRACVSRLRVVEEQLTRARHEQQEWAWLAQLCGRDKLQALELDAAAPAISQYGNLLLRHCFGGRMSLAFRTLDEQQREVFDLVVRNSMSGDELDVRLMSGGEKTIVLHALRLALTLYAKERSGRDFRTIFCDEVDGQLYSEVRREFLEMNRAAMRLGGFTTMFLVSHSAEVIDGADHLLRFGDQQVTVV